MENPRPAGRLYRIPGPGWRSGGGLDFPGFGPHSFRHGNINWRQEVGGSVIEASKIAGHHDRGMTGDYTIVQLERQEELTRAIQGRMADPRKKDEGRPSLRRELQPRQR